jgi:hypothetical protein
MEKVVVYIFFGQLGYKLRPYGIFYAHLPSVIVASWYIFPRFGIFCQDKSGNPGVDTDLPPYRKPKICPSKICDNIIFL